MIIIAGAQPVTTESGVTTETVVLIEGKEGVITFYQEWPPDHSPYQHFDIRREGESRPFCTNGEINSEGSENKNRLDRLLIKFEKTNHALSVCVILDPVNAVDEGVYVLKVIVYGAEIVSYKIKTNVTVIYRSPGEIICYFAKSNYADYLYELHCHAHVVHTNTSLTCFQLGEKLPYIEKAERGADGVRRSFWADHNEAVSCCSHDLKEIVTEETCNQYRWPLRKINVSYSQSMTHDITTQAPISDESTGSAPISDPIACGLLFLFLFLHLLVDV